MTITKPGLKFLILASLAILSLVVLFNVFYDSSSDKLFMLRELEETLDLKDYSDRYVNDKGCYKDVYDNAFCDLKIGFYFTSIESKKRIEARLIDLDWKYEYYEDSKRGEFDAWNGLSEENLCVWTIERDGGFAMDISGGIDARCKAIEKKFSND